jgi:hypothetical protein
MKLTWLLPMAGVVSISGPLVLFSQSTYLAEVTITAGPGSSGTIVSPHDLVKVDGIGRAYVEFHALLPTAKGMNLELGVRPQTEAITYFQNYCCSSNSEGVVSGIVQLGSKEYPLHQDERYSFVLTQSKEQVMQGEILSRAYKLADAGYWPLLLVSILASAIQIVEWGFRLFLRKRML